MKTLRFYRIELLKIYLIDSNVYVSQIKKVLNHSTLVCSISKNKSLVKYFYEIYLLFQGIIVGFVYSFWLLQNLK